MALRTRLQYNGLREPVFRTNKITPTLPVTDPMEMVQNGRVLFGTAPVEETIMRPQVCPPACPEGYDQYGQLKPGWIQPRCFTFPCPAIYVGANGKLPIEADVTLPNGDDVSVIVDENGDVVAAEKRPNWAPLAMAAGLAWLFLM